MSIYIPYTYLIGWSSENLWYYGVRHAKRSQCLYKTGCHPDELWKTYFTTCDKIPELRKKYGEPDVIQIRKTFNNDKDAIEWEMKVLRRLKVLNNDKWINANISGSFIVTGLRWWTDGTVQIKSKTSPGDNYKIGRLPLSIEHREKISKNSKQKGNKPWNYGIKSSDETRKKVSDSSKGKKWWTNGIEQKKAYEKPHPDWWNGHLPSSEETKIKLKKRKVWNKGKGKHPRTLRRYAKEAAMLSSEQ